MSDWWAKKLGTPAPPRQQPAAPYTQNNLPQGMGLDHGRVIDDYLDRRNAPQQQQQAQHQAAPAPGQPDGIYTEEVPDLVDPESGKLNWRRWGGDMRAGAGDTVALGNCPECGSNQYLSRKKGSVFNVNTNQTVYPDPECFACGYKPNTERQGILAVGAKSMGPLRAAPQGASPASFSLQN